MTAIIPIPRCSVSVRLATLADLAFIDGLQKQHTHMVGWMPTKTLEGKIKLKQVIVADDEGGNAVGYCIGNDKYFKHENVGVIYQLNVAPGKQRNLVGASLVKAMFDRAAYGCKLFCLWCAQDIEANRFWESIGFIPLAFRAGSRAKDRIHIFWEKRIREGDTQTPWWYPTETNGGSIREDRLVFPIPPGVHWSDPMPRVLPEENRVSGIGCRVSGEEKRRLPGSTRNPKPEPRNPNTLGRLRFTRPEEKKEKPKREKRPKMKNDPALLAKARELNARWLEEISNNPSALPEPRGKYEVCKQIEAPQSKRVALLEAA
jgi:hypothetical protein